MGHYDKFYEADAVKHRKEMDKKPKYRLKQFNNPAGWSTDKKEVERLAKLFGCEVECNK